MLKKVFFSLILSSMLFFSMSGRVYGQTAYPVEAPPSLDSGEVIYDYAMKLNDAGDRQAAEQYLSQIISRFPGDAYREAAEFKLLYLTILDSIDSGDYATAISRMGQIPHECSVRFGIPWHLCDLAARFEAKGRLDEAAAALQLVLDKHPQSDLVCRARLKMHYSIALSCINAGKYDLAMQQTQIIASECRDNLDTPWHVADIVYRFENNDRFGEAQKTYELMLGDQKTFASYSGIAARGKKRSEAIQQIQARGADSIAVSVCLEQIKQGFGDDANGAYAAFFVGEKMYLQAQKIADTEQKSRLLDAAETMFYYCGGKITDKTAVAENSYMLGLTCNTMGNYYKAAQAFADSYRADPNFKYADYCVFMTGYSYERLLDKGGISKTEATQLIMPVYIKLLAEYPTSIHVGHTQKWLQDNK